LNHLNTKDPPVIDSPTVEQGARFCRDQLYDFIWASGVQGVVTLAFDLGGIVFLVEEVLLFTVLVLVKHRVTPPWEKGHFH
jgi:hypothetical protein